MASLTVHASAVAEYGVGQAWPNPTNMLGACQGVVARCPIPASGDAKGLLFTFAGLSALPVVATVLGVLVEPCWRALATTDIVCKGIHLYDGGDMGNEKGNNDVLPLNVITCSSYGGIDETWGLASPIDASVFHSHTFRINIDPIHNNDTKDPKDADIDCVRLTLYYTLPSTLSGGKRRVGVLRVFPPFLRRQP